MDRRLSPYSVLMKPSSPLPEYPRPQMVRSSYVNLNGTWQYSIQKAEGQPTSWDGTILVPFPPESPLSGVSKMVQPNEFLWYKKDFTIPKGFIHNKVLLHFGAVDQCCIVYINGKEAGRHDGAYLPFHIDITDFLLEKPDDQNTVHEIRVMVIDETDTAPYARGRQKIEHDKDWHTPVSGIWQTVWIESVPQTYIESLSISPLYDESRVEISIQTVGEPQDFQVEIFAQSTRATAKTGTHGKPVCLSLPGAISWHPRNPFLYTVRITCGEDTVASYFGMRKFGIEKDEDGHCRFMLNNKPFFINGINDMGLYSDGLYCPAHDEAFIEDITFAKDCGFTAIHKENKIEPLRWYYHCDRLGMLVWQDLPGGGEEERPTLLEKILPQYKVKDSNYRRTGRESAEGRSTFMRDLHGTAAFLQNSVSLVTWVLFNKGQGQFDAAKLAKQMKQQDPTRLVDHVGGGYDQQAGDIKSILTPEEICSSGDDGLNRLVILNTLGGVGFMVSGHFFGGTPYSQAGQDNTAQSSQELLDKITQLYKNLLPMVKEGLGGFFYTRLSDVEADTSGLLTYNRHNKKVTAKEMRPLNQLFHNL